MTMAFFRSRPSIAILWLGFALSLAVLPIAAAKDAAEHGAETTAAEQASADAAKTSTSRESEQFLERPAPGVTLDIAVAAGQRLVVTFDPAEAQLRVEETDLAFLFPDNAKLVLLGIVDLARSEKPPVIQVSGTDIPSDALLGQAMALASEPSSQETALATLAESPVVRARFVVEVHPRRSQASQVVSPAETYFLEKATAHLAVARDQALFDNAESFFEVVRQIVTMVDEDEIEEWRFRAYSKFDRVRETARDRLRKAKTVYEENFGALPDLRSDRAMVLSPGPIDGEEELSRTLSPKIRRTALDALFRLEAAKAQIPAYEALVASRREIVHVLQQQFEVAQRSLYELLIAEEDLYLAQVERIETEHRQALATVELLAATGQLARRYASLFVTGPAP